MTKRKKGAAHDGPAVCGAKKRGGGECTQRAGWGTDHVGFGRCKLHGGRTPNGTKAAQAEQAEHVVVTLGLPVTTTATDALMAELARTNGHVLFLAKEIGELELEAATQGGAFGGPHPLMQLYLRERAHLAKVAKDCAQVGIDERRIALAEGMAAQIAEFGRAIVKALGLDPSAPEVRQAFRQALTVIDGSAVEITREAA